MTYSCQQAARALGVSRNTLLRWFREGRVSPVARDHRGWRRLTEADLARIQAELGMAGGHPEPVEATRSRARMRAYLRRVPAFRSLSEPLLDELARSARFRGLLAGQRLFSPGDRTLGLQILVKGRARVFRLSPDGREQVLAVVRPYQTLGETALFHPEQRHNSYAVCLEGSAVLVLPPGRLRQLVLQHPELALRFLGAFSQRIEELETRLEELALLSLEQRLARYLLERARHAPEGVVELELSVSELASLLGAARESVSRALLRFRRDGLIAGQGRRLVVDREALERL
ncbi:MAG TPA: helix-turn-helix domain-containing protein [Candidatus Nitrosotenuis sp.]|nr:helix-turn-helix domain-containing protein [Candidatus Nitrosotenuis sp.]